MGSPAKNCASCAYDMGHDCAFPDPQDGSDPPMVATAAMPDRRDGGRHCVQFRQTTAPTPCELCGGQGVKFEDGGGNKVTILSCPLCTIELEQGK